MISWANGNQIITDAIDFKLYRDLKEALYELTPTIIVQDLTQLAKQLAETFEPGFTMKPT